MLPTYTNKGANNQKSGNHNASSEYHAPANHIGTKISRFATLTWFSNGSKRSVALHFDPFLAKQGTQPFKFCLCLLCPLSLLFGSLMFLFGSLSLLFGSLALLLCLPLCLFSNFLWCWY